MEDEYKGAAVKSVILNKGDRQLVWVAARLLMALKPGQHREDFMDQLIQQYRDDIADGHPGADAQTLAEMTINFCGALLFEMERWARGHDSDQVETLRLGAASLQARSRVLEVIRQLLADLDPRRSLDN